MNSVTNSVPPAKPICGIIMPISAIDGCSEVHWAEVKELIDLAINEAGLIPQLVSDADDVGIIQNRIIQNLYENPIAVCDVSGRNPNVMFELGMRLAFDKPTVIIKDDQTPYSFDTGLIEHLVYPRDLRYNKISAFKTVLVEKIIATLSKSQSDKGYSMFLGKIGILKQSRSIAVGDDPVLTELGAIKRHLGATRKTISFDGASTLCASGKGLDGDMATKISDKLLKLGVVNFSATFVGEDHVHFGFPLKTSLPEEFLRGLADEFKINIRLNPGGPASFTDSKSH